MKLEYKVESLNTCISELHSAANLCSAIGIGGRPTRICRISKRQVRLQGEVVMKEKALRDTQIGSIREVGELKRALELRVDEFSVQTLRESHDTIQKLTSQIQELQESVNCMNDSGEFQETESNYSGKCSHVPSQQAVIPSLCSMLSREKRLPLDTWSLSEPQGNVFCNRRPMFDSSQTPYQGIRHSTTPSAAGAVPVQVSTGRHVARGEERIGSTTPMPMSERKSSTTNFFFTSGNPTQFHGWKANTTDIGASV